MNQCDDVRKKIEVIKSDIEEAKAEGESLDNQIALLGTAKPEPAPAPAEVPMLGAPEGPASAKAQAAIAAAKAQAAAGQAPAPAQVDISPGQLRAPTMTPPVFPATAQAQGQVLPALPAGQPSATPATQATVPAQPIAPVEAPAGMPDAAKDEELRDLLKPRKVSDIQADTVKLDGQVAKSDAQLRANETAENVLRAMVENGTASPGDIDQLVLVQEAKANLEAQSAQLNAKRDELSEEFNATPAALVTRINELQQAAEERPLTDEEQAELQENYPHYIESLKTTEGRNAYQAASQKNLLNMQVKIAQGMERLDEIEQSAIDPDRLWKRQTSSMVLSAIGASLIAFGATFSGRGDPMAGLKMIQNRVDQDIRAQMADKKSMSEGLRTRLSMFKSKEAALLSQQASMLKSLVPGLVTLSGKSKDGRLQQDIDLMEAKARDLNARAALREAEHKGLGAAGTPYVDEDGNVLMLGGKPVRTTEEYRLWQASDRITISREKMRQAEDRLEMSQEKDKEARRQLAPALVNTLSDIEAGNVALTSYQQAYSVYVKKYGDAGEGAEVDKYKAAEEKGRNWIEKMYSSGVEVSKALITKYIEAPLASLDPNSATKVLLTQRGVAIANYLKGISGATVTEDEYRRIASFFAEPGDNIKTAKAKADNFYRYANAKVDGYYMAANTDEKKDVINQYYTEGNKKPQLAGSNHYEWSAASTPVKHLTLEDLRSEEARLAGVAKPNAAQKKRLKGVKAAIVVKEKTGQTEASVEPPVEVSDEELNEMTVQELKKLRDADTTTNVFEKRVRRAIQKKMPKKKPTKKKDPCAGKTGADLKKCQFLQKRKL